MVPTFSKAHIVQRVTLSMRCSLLILLNLSFSIGLQAQVPVHEEPRHKPVFTTAQMRALNVLLPPGDTTQYHLHNTPSLFLFLTSTTTGSQLQGGAPSTGRSTGGTILFENLTPPHVRIHRVWNIDTTTFHVMDIELLSNDSGFTTTPLAGSQLQLAVDTPWVRAYKVMLESNKPFVLKKAAGNLFLVALAGGDVRLQGKHKQWKEGDFVYIATGKPLTLQNDLQQPMQFALVELP
jgi:hypothetical protein